MSEVPADEAVTPDGQHLADVLSEFASTMLTDFPIQDILDHLVERIVEILPISSAGVTLISPGTDPRYIAASDEAALRYEKLQTELDEGPCLRAYQSGEAVEVPDLRTDERFPNFRPRAINAGLAAVFTFPLRHGDHRLGALDLYREEPGRLSPKAMVAAQTLADVVTAYLLNAQAREDLQDLSDRSRTAALHDSLTGLPNRVLMLERLELAFLRSRRSRKATAVLFVDLDRFKKINDAYGHQVGDEVLIAVARRLGSLLRPADTLARLSGDEFVIICEDLDSPDQAAGIVSRLVTGLSKPLLLSHDEIAMTASIGIAYSEHSDHADYNPKQLIHEADLAMYEAKRQGGHRQVFQPRSLRLVGLEHDLPSAQSRGELHLEYQPILATSDRHITGFEALLRWHHPTRGVISPTRFIPLAETSGLIHQIGQWVLEQAWADRHSWQDQFPGDDLEMSVNVSANQVMSAGFTATVAAVLATNDDRPELLTLEITENVFIQDNDRALIILNDLKALGVRLALDDFGTGYSSLSYLKRFPVDVIKIDRSFIADLDHDPASLTIVGAVVQLAHGLGMTVVAEGVETAEQFSKVTELGCDHCQGFYFARPTPAARIDTLIGPLSGRPEQIATAHRHDQVNRDDAANLDDAAHRDSPDRAIRDDGSELPQPSADRPTTDDGAGSSDLHGSAHHLLLYGDDDSLVEKLTTQFRAALPGPGNTIVIATSRHRAALRDALPQGLLAVAEQDGRFTALDAADTLARFMVDGRPDPALFDKVLGTLVRTQLAAGGVLNAYGEMVGVLWTEGNVVAALELERLWNDLQRSTSFDLTCAYPTSEIHAGHSEFADLCNQHTTVHMTGSPDPAGGIEEAT